MGQLIGRGLDEAKAIHELTQAARSMGLEEPEIVKTIQSGMQSGKANPRAAVGFAERVMQSGIDIRDHPLLDAASGDVQNALEVIKAFGKGNLLHALSSLWHWDGKGVWARIDDREVRKAIHRVAWEHPKFSKNIISSILDIVKTEVTIKDSVFDSHDDCVINCRGGELYLIDGQWSLRPARRESYITSQLPVEHDV